MSKEKISKTQREILEQLKKGYYLTWSSNINPVCYLQGNKELKSISFATTFALVRKGLLEEVKDRKPYTEKYTISKKGRDLLKQND